MGQESNRRSIAANKRGDSNRVASSFRLTYAILFIIAGFALASAGTAPSAFQELLFGTGILLWAIGVLGAVYWVVNRLVGPRAAKWAVGLLVLSLIIHLIFGQRDD